MKIMVDAQTHEILGAAILGTGGDGGGSLDFLDAMYAKSAVYGPSSRAMHISPDRFGTHPSMLGEL